MRTFVRNVPFSVAVFAIAVVVAIVLSPHVASRLHTRRPVAASLLIGFGLVVAATLTPTAGALDGVASDGSCNMSRIGFLPLGALLHVNGASLNVLLFVPLGIAVGLLPRARTTALIAIVAVALPFLVEGTQLVVTVLGRECGIADIFDNLLGLGIGVVLGTIARPLTERWLSSRVPPRT